MTIPDAEFTYLYSVEYEYDDEGRLEEQIYPQDTFTYEYDDQGFLEESESDASGKITEYTCDEHGNIICVEYSDGSRIELEYEEMTVTPEEAEAYRCRWACLEIRGYEYFQYQNCFFYYLIPNPRWETYIPYEYY